MFRFDPVLLLRMLPEVVASVIGIRAINLLTFGKEKFGHISSGVTFFGQRRPAPNVTMIGHLLVSLCIEARLFQCVKQL